MYTLIINFPFSSVNDEQYMLALHMSRDGAFTDATTAMDADSKCFTLVDQYQGNDGPVTIYEGTLCGSVIAEDDNREDMFTPLAPSKLKFNIACQQFPAWLMNVCDYATNVRVVLYAVTEQQANPLRVRWRGYLLCNTLNMTVVDDLMACPVVAVDEIGIAKYMPFRANCDGHPARLSLYALFKKWWEMNWADNFRRVYLDFGLPTNQAAMYWHRNAALDDDDGNEVKDLLNTLVINLERYYLDRDATWETVLNDVCQYLGVHFCIGGYAGNYSFDNYVLASYDSGVFTTYAYGFKYDTVDALDYVRYSVLGNQQKVGADIQITYDPDKYKGVKVTSKPTRPEVHKYLDHDNVKAIAPNAGHDEWFEVRIGQQKQGAVGQILKYWRLMYTEIVDAEDQWTEEADYLTLEPCEVSFAGRSVGASGYFPMTDAPFGRTRPNGDDTDSLEFVLEKRGMIPVRIGSFEYIDPSWTTHMADYLFFLHNLWGRKYWDKDEPYTMGDITPFKVATIYPFGTANSIIGAEKTFLALDFKCMILNENLGRSAQGIVEFTGTGLGYTDNLYGSYAAVFPMTETYHNYADGDDNTSGRLADNGYFVIHSTYPYLTVRLRIGNWFYYYEQDPPYQRGWTYYADPDDAPTFRLPLLGNVSTEWVLGNGISSNVVENYYYTELHPVSRVVDPCFYVPLEGISTHSQPLEGRVCLEIWWPTDYLNRYTIHENNILGMLLHDFDIRFTDAAEIANDEIQVTETELTDPNSNTKEIKKVGFALSTPKVDGVFENALLYDGGKAWHNLRTLRWQGGSDITCEQYVSNEMANVYRRPQMWVELQREFAAADYGNIANLEFRVHSLTEAPKGIFVPVTRRFDFTKGWVKWKLQQLTENVND